MKFILFVLLFITIAVLYAFFENVFVLFRRHENLGGNVKILHISDCHRSNKPWRNRRIISAAKAENPDFIFITGDFVSRTETDFSPAEALLRDLCLVAPVYMCMGNHEQSFLNDNLGEFFEAVDRTDAKMLVNCGEHAEVKGRKFYICGLMQNYTTYKKDGGYKNLDGFTLSEMQNFLGECPCENTLLLAHNPLFGQIYADWGADFTFSGHIHGGVVRLFGKGILSPERRLFPQYSKGIYDISGKKLLVSAGIGKLRMFNPPEVIIYKI